MIDHHFQGDRYLDISKDIELPDERLPSGPLPIWIEAPEGVSQLEILSRVSQLHGINDTPVTVLYPFDKSEAEASQFCLEMKWRYAESWSMYGMEDHAIILLDATTEDGSLVPEFVSRASRKLIFVTASNNSGYKNKSEIPKNVNLHLLALHSYNFYEDCNLLANCPYEKEKLIEKRLWVNVNVEERRMPFYVLI